MRKSIGPLAKKLVVQTLGLVLLVQGAGVVQPARASGPFTIEPIFFDVRYDPRQFLDGTRFSADGNSLAQVLTFLHLSGTFSSGHQRLFEAYLQSREQSGYSSGFSEWQQNLGALGRDAGYFSTSKMVSTTLSSNGQSYTVQSYFENCLRDAFATANTTLQDRLNRYDRDSAQMNRWLDAQIRVFGHCNNSSFNPPEEASSSWEPLERFDRDYQIAAAYFYDMQYEEAARRFQLISAQPDSPWSDLSRYLVGRSLVRQALVKGVDTQQNLNAAKTLFDMLGEDEEYLQRFPSVRGQQTYISIKLDTPAFLDRVGTQLVEDPGALSPNELADFLFLWNSARQEAAEDGSLSHWLRLANDPSPPATQSIVQAWQQYRTRPWLYLALARNHADPASPGIAALIQETIDLPADTPTNAALLVATLRLLQASGRTDQALALTQRLLADPQNTLSGVQRNLVQFAFAESATDWRDYPERAQIAVSALSWDGNQYFDMTARAFAAATHESPLLPRAAVDVLNGYYTPAMLLEVIKRGGLSPYLSGRVAIAAWVKALMLGDATTAREAARLLQTYFPERHDAFERYLQSATPDFEAAAIVLESPAFSPFIRFGIGRIRMGFENGFVSFVPDHIADGLRQQNWWCTAVYDYQYASSQEFYRQQWLQSAARELSRLPAFSTFDDVRKNELAGMYPQLQQGVAAVFGPAVVAYATAHADDPRVPRLLHRVVFASHNACSGGLGNVSRAAFELLHKNYPDSEWAAQTPYWYE